ncbi:MAG: hypothetical protein KGY99_01830 [Phycisphaerae bacterium]|nr:hypothetical protein [Phycisphaerae bacterium]
MPLLPAALLLVGGVWLAAPPVAGQGPTSRPANAPADNLEYWLDRAAATTAPAEPPASRPRSRPGGQTATPAERGAVPGAVELSDGRRLTGWLQTAGAAPFEVFIAREKRWRRIPPAAVWRIEAVVVFEKMALRWRWKGTGEPERVYTGRKYPTRRLQWRFTLADGTTLTGAVKGKPLHLRRGGKRLGPFVLHERMAGRDGQSLGELVYVRRVVISRGAMQATEP